MADYITPVASWCVVIIEAIGVGIITLFALYSLFNAAMQLLKKTDKYAVYLELRQTLGRGILLGLEFLIAADIIYTVAVELTLENIGVLAIVVLIRTFLSFTLEVEITGRWPWQQKEFEQS